MFYENTALVLEGGGARAAFSTGVIDTMLQEGILFDLCVGVSAGAIVGMHYVSNQSSRLLQFPEALLLEYAKVGNPQDRIDMVDIYHRVSEHLEPFDFNRFFTTQTDFSCNMVQAINANVTYVEKEEMTSLEKLVSAVMASSSLPEIAKPVKISGNPYYDGGLVEPLPVKRCLNKGLKTVVVLTQDISYRKTKPYLIPEDVAKDYPYLVSEINSRNLHYNATLDEISKLEDANSLFVFRPSEPVEVSVIEPRRSKLKSLYLDGRKQSLQRIDLLRRFLKCND